ncbi:3-isopropylmalate dehydratase large subunit 1 [Parvularcula lutaonensis]|nr:3-isopropylmalate dehydratase large subunit 1 [Parvularcula lutaonensis]
MFDKLWDAHRVEGAAIGGHDLIAIDRLLLHERTGGVALKSLAEKGLRPLDPKRAFAVMDHIVSFREGRDRDEARSPGGGAFITETRAMATEAGLNLIDTDHPSQGIVHVIAPELAIAAPGLTLVCPDSHTCSLGALGALAWGIGSSEAEHALATGCVRVKKPKQMRIRIEGRLPPGVTAKDLALHIIANYGANGGNGCAIEYSGEAVADLDIEARLTLCNLAVEFAAFTAVIAPDEKTRAFLEGKPFAPPSNVLRQRLETDEQAVFDREILIEATTVSPQISWGTSPEETISLSGRVPTDGREKALRYMGLAPGMPIEGVPIGGAFIGSCTNGRLSDLVSAAKVLRGRKVAEGVRAVCVPGSQGVKREAERQGLDVIFKDAGFEWGAPGCAMCFYAGGETFAPGTRVVSSTNRNFEGRQGPGVRTHLTNPAVVAASAVAGRIASPSSLPVREEAA